MPKIIPDLGPRILEAAARAFEARGFDGTDMKSLTSELGISVGTLYNYYPSKPELFLEVTVHWKRELNRRLLERLDRDDSSAAKLRDTLLMLFDNMVTYSGIWKEYMRSGSTFRQGTPHGNRFREDNEALNQRIQSLFREVWAGHPGAAPLVNDPQGRLGQVIVGSIMQLVMASPETPAANRDFVVQWIDFFAPTESP